MSYFIILLTSKADWTRASVPSNQVQASSTIGAFHVWSGAIVHVHGACQSSIVAIPRGRHRCRGRPTPSTHAFCSHSNVTSAPCRSARHGIWTTLLLNHRRLPFPVLSLAFVYVYGTKVYNYVKNNKRQAKAQSCSRYYIVYAVVKWER